MVKKKKENPDANLEAVETALTRTEQYIENNRKILLIVLSVIVLVVGGYFGYKKLYLQPLEEEAQSQMFVAEQYFEKDSFNLALNGDMQFPGFLTIIEDYSGTKAENLSHYYAGICYLRLGDYESALSELAEFSSDDKMLGPIAVGASGDALVELGRNEEALDYYNRAANDKPNEFTTPVYLMKYAFVLEQLNRWDEALKVYERIEKEYNRTNEGRRIEKYITRAKIKLNLN